jgi:hypothetical protein
VREQKSNSFTDICTNPINISLFPFAELEFPQQTKTRAAKKREKTRTNAATFVSFPASMFSISEIWNEFSHVCA